MPASRNPIVFVHGYSDTGKSWGPWREILRQRLGIEDALMHTCSYVSLDNGISIKDIAEGFDRALAAQGGLGPDQPFDAIVHSTGMLVVRAWLAADPLRTKRLKRLVAFAPATFGSPLAKQGRSWLGAVFKGNKQLGPDFLEAGDQILLELELASAFTWRLAKEESSQHRGRPMSPISATAMRSRSSRARGTPRSHSAVPRSPSSSFSGRTRRR
jgi:pimeloyl-ACP methyl ester carboxylesterase